MLSAQNIKGKKFEKSLLGGYDPKACDDFLEEVATDFALIQKENTALKEKLKELTTKNEEYKSVEQSMRKALISAQKIANDMVEKAELERDKILEDAKEIAHEQITTYRTQIAEEQEKLRIAKEKTSSFASKVTAFYEKQIEDFTDLSKDLPVIKTAEFREEFTLELSEENKQEIASIKDVDAQSITEDILEKIKSETINPKVLVGASDDTIAIESLSDLEEIIEDEEENEEETLKVSKPEPKFNFSELKFGKGYKEN